MHDAFVPVCCRALPDGATGALRHPPAHAAAVAHGIGPHARQHGARRCDWAVCATRVGWVRVCSQRATRLCTELGLFYRLLKPIPNGVATLRAAVEAHLKAAIAGLADKVYCASEPIKAIEVRCSQAVFFVVLRGPTHASLAAGASAPAPSLPHNSSTSFA